MYKVSIMSGKGGVGKTTTCLGTALALTSLGFSVGILDLDVENPSLGIACGKGREDLVFGGTYITPPRWHDVPIMSLSLLPLPAFRDTPTLVDEERKHHIIRQLYSEVDWGSLDVLLIDMPPGSGEEVRGLMQLSPDGVVIVTSPQEMSEAAVRRLAVMAEEYNLRVIGLLQNDVNGAPGNAGENVSRDFDLPLLATIAHRVDIPMAMEAHESIDHVPFLLVATAIMEAASPPAEPVEFQEMTDKEWDRVQVVLPAQAAGRQRNNDRLVIDGIRLVTLTVTPWAKMPEQYGAWKTAWNRHDAWTKSGVWGEIEKALSQQSNKLEEESFDAAASGNNDGPGPQGVLRERSDTGEPEGSRASAPEEVPGCNGEVGSLAHSAAAPGSESDS